MTFDTIGKIAVVICAISILNSLIGDMFFRLKYSFPRVSAIATEAIDTSKEPIQVSNNEYTKFKIRGEKNYYYLLPQADYSISSYIVAKNTNFWLRDLMRNHFDDIALIDFGMVWGDLAKDPALMKKHLKFKSKKTLGQARALYWKYNYHAPWGVSYINTHIAHTHIIPANKNVMGALLKVKVGDKVKLDGYLVDAYTTDNWLFSMTSLSRHDSNITSRGHKKGGGACEIMYVNKVQIKNKIYY